MASPFVRLFALIAVLAALGLGACGDDEGDQSASPAEASQPTTVEDPDQALENTSVKPELPKPTGSPPRKLEREDIVAGRGRRAKAGDTVVVEYVGVTFSTGEEFDASWDRGQPFTFALGGEHVIEGWDRGIVGMRKGGRRQLTIPPEQAYGAEGQPPDIGPNETLVFVVDLVAIR